jgi:hypothetical protein
MTESRVNSTTPCVESVGNRARPLSVEGVAVHVLIPVWRDLGCGDFRMEHAAIPLTLDGGSIAGPL